MNVAYFFPFYNPIRDGNAAGQVKRDVGAGLIRMQAGAGRVKIFF